MKKKLFTLISSLLLLSIFTHISYADSVKINTNNLNVRTSPWGKLIGEVNKGKEFKIYNSKLDDNDDTWYKIKYNSNYGWIHSKYTKKIKKILPENKDTIIINTDYLNVRTAPWGDWLSQVNKGEKYNVIDTGLDDNKKLWYKVKYGNNSGWVHSDYVIIDNKQNTRSDYITVNSSILNVRTAPWGDWIGQINKGQTFDIEEEKFDPSGDKWYKIKYYSSYGWVHSNFVTKFEKQKIKKTTPVKENKTISVNYLIVNTDVLNVRTAPWGNWIGQIKNKEEYKILNKKNDTHNDPWYEINYKNKKGWVHSDYVILKQKTQKAPKDKTFGKIISNENYLNIRTAPWGDWIGQINKGQTFDIYDAKKDKNNKIWYKIKFNSKFGWVHSDYVTAKNLTLNLSNVKNSSDIQKNTKPKYSANVEKNKEVKINETSYTIIKNDFIDVKKSPRGKFVTKLKEGKRFSVISYMRDNTNNLWFKIKYDSKVGWTHIDYLNGYINSKSNQNTIVNKNALYNGIDISYANSNVYWDKLKKDNIKSVIVRAGYSTEVDEFAKINIDNALRNHLHVGAYWFIYSINVNEAKLEANAFADFMEQYKGRIDLPLFADFEYDTERWANQNNVYFTKDLRSKIVAAFLDTLEKRGWYVGNYANVDYLEYRFNFDLIKEYDIWLADWDDVPDSKWFPISRIHQYSDNGKAYGDGVGRTDMNRIYTDYPKIIKDRAYNGY